MYMNYELHKIIKNSKVLLEHFIKFILILDIFESPGRYLMQTFKFPKNGPCLKLEDFLSPDL